MLNDGMLGSIASTYACLARLRNPWTVRCREEDVATSLELAGCACATTQIERFVHGRKRRQLKEESKGYELEDSKGRARKRARICEKSGW